MPSTLGIVSSHINYVPPTFSIVPDKTTIKEGEIVTYTITTTNYNSSNIYATNSGTTANADLNIGFGATIPLVGGTATLAISALNDDNVEGPETLIVNLRTGSTTGPIVATAPTVTINDMTPMYGGSTFSGRTGDLTSSGSTSTLSVTGGLIKDGRWHKFEIGAYTNFSGNCVAADFFVNSTFIGAAYIGTSCFTGQGYTVKYARVSASDTVTLRATRSGPGMQGPIYSHERWPHGYVTVYPQTNASFAITG